MSVLSAGESDADPLYQHLIVTAERKFWRCVERAVEEGLDRFWMNIALLRSTQPLPRRKLSVDNRQQSAYVGAL
jgi:hypothetical protein